MSIRNPSLPLWIVFALLLTGCSTSTISGSWTDPAIPAGQIKRVAVLGVAKNETARRSFEDKMTAQLKTMGVDAQPTYPFIPQDDPPDESAMSGLLTSQGIDTVMVVQVTNERTESMVSPGTVQGYGYPYGAAGFGGYDGWYGSYSRSYSATYTPARVVNYEVLTIEATLHAVSSDTLYWTAQTETIPENSLEKAIDDLVSVLIKNLQDSKVFN